MSNIVSVNFRGDVLYGFEGDDGIFMALKPMVEAMGLDWSAQLKRTKRDPILSEGMAIMATPFGRGGDQESACLKLELVNGWFFSIDSSRIKDDSVREKVLLYQREGYKVLFEHFYKGKKKPVAGPEDEETDVKLPISERRQLVAEARQTFGHQAAGQLWFQLGLRVVPAMLEPEREADLFDLSRIRTVSNAPSIAPGDEKAA